MNTQTKGRTVGLLLKIGITTLALQACAQDQPPELAASTNAPAAPDLQSPPTLPAVLPGKGLAEHDFFYAGEAKEEKMFIVRQGKVVWSYTHPGKGEISDAVRLSNGNVLFAHQFGVTEISADKQVVWNFDAPSKTEIHTAQPIGQDRLWFIQNGNPAKCVVVNKVTGKTEKEFVLPVKNPEAPHGHFRHARLTSAGTLLVAHMDLSKVCEYDLDGKELWFVEIPNPWSAVELKNGNILIVSNKKFVREVDRKGETIWEFAPADLPGYQISNLQLATRLPNGNTLVNNWFNQWAANRLTPENGPVQAVEITPEKKVVWALRSWTGETNLGPSTIIQLLDEPGIPENVKFGSIH